MKEAMKLALEALEDENSLSKMKTARDILRKALAQPEQGEPVALHMDAIVVNLLREGINKHRARELAEHFIKHTTPPQRTWVGLDPEEIRKTNHHMVDGAYHYSFKQGAEWAEAKLKEKNT